MAINTVTQVSQHEAFNSGGLTTWPTWAASHATSAGDTLVAVVSLTPTTGVNLSSFSDDAGNSYTIKNESIASISNLAFAYCKNAAALTTSSRFTAVGAASSTGLKVGVIAISADNPVDLDDFGHASNSNTATPSATGSALTGTSSILVGMVAYNASAAITDTWTQAGGFTGNTDVVGDDGAGHQFGIIRWAYQLVTTAGPFTYAPSSSAARANVRDIVSFRELVPSPTTADAAITLGAMTASGAATVTDTAAAAITLGALTLTAAGNVVDTAAASITLGALTLNATAGVTDAAAATITLGALTLSGAAAVTVTAAAAITLGGLALTGAGVVTDTAAAAIQLGALTLSATGNVVDTAAASITLGTLTLTAAGQVLVTANAAITLGALTLQATAGSFRPFRPIPVGPGDAPMAVSGLPALDVGTRPSGSIVAGRGAIGVGASSRTGRPTR